VSDWRSHLALGAVLAVVAGVALTAGLEAAGRRWLRNPTDAALVAHFRAHRGELQAVLAGAHARGESLLYVPHSAWFPRARFGDVKGYAHSARPLANLVEDLDGVVSQPRRPGRVMRWHRALEGEWYLYRELGGGR
jgi:hypothetical protein